MQCQQLLSPSRRPFHCTNYVSFCGNLANNLRKFAPYNSHTFIRHAVFSTRTLASFPSPHFFHIPSAAIFLALFSFVNASDKKYHMFSDSSFSRFSPK